MSKRGRSQKKDNRNPKRRHHHEDVASKDMDDEIDAFHKQRDVVPLEVNGDVGESDEDNEQPVFDFEDINNDEDDDDEDMDDGTQLSNLAAKIARQQRFLQAKIGGVEDEMHDDDEEDEEENKVIWGREKSQYYDADNRDFELQSSDDESPAEEEAEVLRMQREKAKSLTMEDFGLEDVSQDESDKELTLEEIMAKGKSTLKFPASKEDVDNTAIAYEEVNKDLNALSREEQMDVLYSSAPELVGLLAELNDALDQLERKINPLLTKIKERQTTSDEGMRYLEVKQLLLLAYCQAITFYLLLKSEGQPVRDHPVIARLVEIKGLLDKMKQLDGNLMSELEEILNKNHGAETVVTLVRENEASASDSFTKSDELPLLSVETREAALPHEKTEMIKVDSLTVDQNKVGKHKRQNDQVGIQSMEMLKVRAALEEKLKQKFIFNSIVPKPDKAKKHIKPVNGQLETYDDFDDDAIDVKGSSHGGASNSKKVSRILTSHPNKPKAVSGDDDLPRRDDIGERRRKHELRVLAGAGIMPENEEFGDELDTCEVDEDADVEDDDETVGSEDEFYKQVKQQREAKLAAKAEIYTRTSAIPSLPETIDGKRQINYQMEKNRGLTRARKKLIKNPRKKYKLKHQKAVVRRKGQVRETRKPTGPYGGEASGINATISRSIRFKN